MEQVGALAAATELLVEVERTLSAVMAARDGLLAFGAQIATEMAESAAASAGDAGGRDADRAAREAGELAARTVSAEFAAALRVSDRTVQRRMIAAEDLVSRFPRLWRAQGAGVLSAWHVRGILDAGAHLDDPADRDAYAEQMIEFAQTATTGRTTRLARRIAERFQSRSIDERHTDARRDRRAWVRDRPDGMAEFVILGPAALVHGALARITAMAHIAAAANRAAESATGAGTADVQDARSLNQRRCDIALDLLLTGTPVGHDTPDRMLASIAPTVAITVPVTTLLGVDTTPAELDGCIPVDAATARLLAGSAAAWIRILTHPHTGALLATDTYRPTAALTRHLRSRDQHCRFPTCGHPARDCDLDHTRDHALGGPTTLENLSDLCRRHHTLKHHTPWQVEHLGHGTYAWTSPTGRTYLDTPPPQNTTTYPDDHPPPF